jgi:hypothetical protein
MTKVKKNLAIDVDGGIFNIPDDVVVEVILNDKYNCFFFCNKSFTSSYFVIKYVPHIHIQNNASRCCSFIF